MNLITKRVYEIELRNGDTLKTEVGFKSDGKLASQLTISDKEGNVKTKDRWKVTNHHLAEHQDAEDVLMRMEARHRALREGK